MQLGAFLTTVRANIFGPRADGSILREVAPRPGKLYLQQRGDAARLAELVEEGAQQHAEAVEEAEDPEEAEPGAADDRPAVAAVQRWWGCGAGGGRRQGSHDGPIAITLSLRTIKQGPARSYATRTRRTRTRA